MLLAIAASLASVALFLISYIYRVRIFSKCDVDPKLRGILDGKRITGLNDGLFINFLIARKKFSIEVATDIKMYIVTSIAALVSFVVAMLLFWWPGWTG